MMKIEKLFKKDINRDIQGVVTIGNEEESRKKHGLWPTASAALGRMMSVTLMMAAMNKNNEKMTDITELLQRNIDILTIYDILLTVGL